MSTFDFVVIGSGPGGASTAWHLAKALPSAQIVVLEAGRPTQGDPETFVPLSGYKLAMTDNWGYFTTPQEALGGRPLPAPAGKIVGGGSTINAMAWHRGPKGDHERIASLAGDSSFGYEQIRKAQIDLETFHADVPRPFADLTNGVDVSRRGKSGPIQISFNDKTIGDGTREFLAACDSVGIPTIADYNDAESHVGAALLQWSHASGFRNSSSFCFLDDGKRPSNVTLLPNSEVIRVEFEGTKATGVRVKDAEGKESVIKATKEVIVSAGAIGTPRLLQLSGIGDREHLKKVGITPVAHVPAVGEGLQDHMMLNVMWRVPDTVETFDKLFHDNDALMAAVGQYQSDQSGLLTAIASGSVAHVRDANLLQTKAFAELPKQAQEHIKDSTRAHYQIVKNNTFYTKDVVASPDGPHIATACWLLNLQSSGSVKITSSDPSVKPEVTLNYMNHPFDREVAKAAVRQCLKIGDSPTWKDFGAKLAFGPKSHSEADLDKFVLDEAFQGVHLVGTSRVGQNTEPDLSIHPPAPYGSVVDRDLRVFGTQHLRVADVSIIPFPTSAGPQATVYAHGAIAARKIATAAA